MPSDLTPEQRAELLEAIRKAYWHVPSLTEKGKDRCECILDAFLPLLAGWTPPAPPDAIAAAEARGRLAGIEEAATLCDRLPLSEDWPSRIRALSSIPPQEADHG